MNSLWMGLGRAFSKGLRQSEITVNPTSSERTRQETIFRLVWGFRLSSNKGGACQWEERDILTRSLPCSEWVHQLPVLGCHPAYMTRLKEFASWEELRVNEAEAALRHTPNLNYQNEGKCIGNQMKGNENSYLRSFVDSLLSQVGVSNNTILLRAILVSHVLQSTSWTKYKSSNFNTLPTWGTLRSSQVLEGGMGNASSLDLAPGLERLAVKTLQKQSLIILHS
jgi:hypothetical protein